MLLNRLYRDGVQIDGQGIDLTTRHGLDPVDEGNHLAEPGDVVPDVLIIGVKNMWAVFFPVKFYLAVGIIQNG